MSNNESAIETDRRMFLRGAAAGVAGLAGLSALGACGVGTDAPGLDDALGARDVDGSLDTSGIAADSAAAHCRLTEPNIRGPFYRPGAPRRASALASPTEPGRRLVISGLISGPGCRTPLAGALVDVWQADKLGRYDNTSTQYKLRGVLVTGTDGRYSFGTVYPGYYLNGPTYRPAHIHYTITAPGHAPLTTQLYFKGDPYLATDPFDRPALVIKLNKSRAVWRGIFNIVLAKV